MTNRIPPLLRHRRPHHVFTLLGLVTQLSLFKVQFLDQPFLFTDSMPTTLPPSYLRNECQGLHRSWLEGLKELKSITHPESRQLQIEHLSELYAKAKVIELTASDQLDDQCKGLLAHITSRSFEGHVTIAKGSENLIKLF